MGKGIEDKAAKIEDALVWAWHQARPGTTNVL